MIKRFSTVCLLLLLSLSGEAATKRWIPKIAAAAGSSLQTPSVIHYVDTPNSGTDAFFTNGVAYVALPETNIAGQTIALGIFWTGSSSATLSVSDDKTNTWTKAMRAQDVGNTTYGEVWIVPNIAASTRVIQITNTHATVRLTNWCAQAMVINNITNSSPLDGTNSFAASSSGTMSAGSITPTQTGDFFVQFARVDAGTIESHQATASAQGSTAFELITCNQTGGYFMQGGVYSSTSALNPQMTVSPSATYLSMAVALKASSSTTGGTPTGMYVVGIHHEAVVNNATLTQTYQWPVRGNLLVQAWQSGYKDFIVTNSTSSAGTWTDMTGGPVSQIGPSSAGAADFWYATNMTKTTTLLVTNKLKSSSTGHGTYFVYDIGGARITAPEDFVTRGANTFSVGNSPGQVSTTNVYDPPPILVSASGGIILTTIGQDENTVHDMAQSGWYFDSTIWAGNNIDGPSQLDQNNGWAHYRPSDTTTAAYHQWNYQWTDAVGFYSSASIALLPSGGTHVAPKFAFIQNTNTSSASATTITKAFPANTTAGGLIVVGVQIGTTGRTITVTNTQGNTFFVGSTAVSDGQGDAVAFYYATNITGGASTIGVHVSGAATFIAFTASEYSTPATTTTLDQVAAANFASATSLSSGNITTTGADELLVGFVSFGDSNSILYTPGAPYTQRAILTGVSAMEDRITKATGTFSATYTVANATSGRFVLCSFK